jgi:hypothetical protein
MKSTPSFVLAALSAALLAGCGGSGGDDSGGTSQPTAVAINSGNQTDVARATVAGGMTVALAGGGANNATGGAAAARVAALGRAAIASFGRVGRESIAGAGRHAAGSSSSTDNCGVSGSITSTFNDNDGNGAMSVGDSVTIVYNACHDTATSSVSGTVSVTVTSVSGSTFSATANVQNVQATDQGLSSTVNGQFTISDNETATQDDETLTIGSNGLTVSVQSTSFTDTLTFASGMHIETVYDNASGDTRLSLNGGMSSNKLAGSLTLTTVQPVVQLAADAYPSSGQVRAVGANGSALLMTVLNTTQVQLQLDADGNGSYEATSTANWSTLIGQQG